MAIPTIERLFDIPKYQLDKRPSDKAFNYKVGKEWKSVSSKQFVEDIDTISNALLTIGIKPKDHIALITHVNSYYWHVLDMALMQIGAVGIPLYPTLTIADFKYVLDHSESKLCFVSNKDLYNKISGIQSDTAINKIYSFDDKVSEDNFSSLLALGKENDHSEEVKRIKSSIKTDDLATIIYTSGTTGIPKGAMISHKALLCSSVQLCSHVINKKPEDKFRTLSYLPVNHIFERMAVYFYMFDGIDIYFAESLLKLVDNFKEVKPHIIPIVPRLLEKVFDKIISTGQDLTGFKKKLFFWSVNLAENYDINGNNSMTYKIQHKIADKLIFSKWRDIFGGQLQFLLSGSAPLQERLVTVFRAAGIPIYEGYGMTESAGVISANDSRKNGIKLRSVGKPSSILDIKIADDGEILVKGDTVFMGYYKNQEKTAEVLKDGYLHTEDIGVLDENGFLSITDRKKEIFKISNGKYIAPAVVENQLKQSSFIEQIIVVGEGQKSPGAIIQLNYEKLKEWSAAHQHDIKDYTSFKPLLSAIKKDINLYNKSLSDWQRVKQFKISPEEWTVEGGQLTPTLKTKRRKIKTMYSHLIEEMYN